MHVHSLCMCAELGVDDARGHAKRQQTHLPMPMLISTAQSSAAAMGSMTRSESSPATPCTWQGQLLPVPRQRSASACASPACLRLVRSPLRFQPFYPVLRNWRIILLPARPVPFPSLPSQCADRLPVGRSPSRKGVNTNGNDILKSRAGLLALARLVLWRHLELIDPAAVG